MFWLVVYYLLEYLPIALLGAPVLLWIFLNIRKESHWRAGMLMLSWAALALSAARVVALLPYAPRDAWSCSRMTPGVAWAMGDRLYHPPGQGPLLVRMYGPVSAMVYAPTALLATPTVGVLAGAGINLALFAIPMVWFLRCSGMAATGERPDASFILVGAALFALFATHVTKLLYTAAAVTVDAPAIGLAACACAMLVRSAGSAAPLRSGLLVGALAAASLWSKQTLAPIVVALPVYVLLVGGWRWGWRCILGMVLAAGAISYALLLAFGVEAMLFHTLIVPVRHPWQWPWLDKPHALLRAMRMIRADAMPALVLLIVGLGLRLLCAAAVRLGEARRPESTRHVRLSDRIAAWARANPWLVPALLAICVLPTTGLAYAKVLGRGNNAAATSYFLLLAACSAIITALQVCFRGSDASRDTGPAISASAAGDSAVVRPWARVLAMSVCLAFVLGIAARPREWLALPRQFALWGELSSSHLQIAYQYARQHPGEVYIPQYPLATLFSEGRAYHYEPAIQDLHLAGLTLSPRQLDEGLPPRLRQILVRDEIPAHLPVQLRQRFTRVDRPADMPGWLVLREP
ncbi:hypothetical protein [Fontivita pretiosa]|uniref:hypothetical protein n=1 Tax=Fontivita pretiosa TaxID=2989684 RepID=UPI003D164382